MNFVKLTIPLFIALIYAPAQVSATSLLGAELESLSVFSKEYATFGANSQVFGNVLSGDVATIGANASVFGNFVSVGAANTGGASSLVTGNIISGGVATTGDGSIIRGSITSSGASTIGANAQVLGNMVSGGALTTGANSTVFGNILSGGAATVGANSIIKGSVAAVGDITVSASGTTGTRSALATSPVVPATLTSDLAAKVTTNSSQIATAQTALKNMGAGTVLAATMTTDTTLYSGVYSAASLSTTASTTLTLDGHGLDNQFWVFNITDILATGAATKIELINAGAGASVIWNTGGYASLGANSTFLGTILSKDYTSVGALTNVTGVGSSCGSVYSATSYVSTGAGSKIGSGGCAGIGSGFDIVNDVAVHRNVITSAVPEPESYALLLAGLGLMAGIARRRNNKNA